MFKMIGNDIVDLKAAEKESNWQRKGFLNKLFTLNEQQFILSSDNPFVNVWLLWSMKESAYKCYVQENKRQFFLPTKFQCSMISKTTGIVMINNIIYYTKSKISKRYIHTISSKDKLLKNYSQLFYIKDNSFKNQHDITYFKLKNTFSNILRKETNKIDFYKNEIGIPKLKIETKKIEYPFSISHHGNYGGFAVVK